jgi:hypothetical protein
MDQRPTANANRQRFTDLRESGRRDSSELAYQRLNTLLEINAKTAQAKMLYKSEQEKLEAELMRHPLDTSKTFSYLLLSHCNCVVGMK